MDIVAKHAAAQGWPLRPHIILVEGTSDAALFKLADDLCANAGQVLLGDEICIAAAGEKDRGGTFGVARELFELRGMTRYLLDPNGRPSYRVMALVDNDHAGREIIKQVRRMDNSVSEYRDIVKIRPIPPAFQQYSPSDREQECYLANLPYWGLDWEIEDTLSSRLLQLFEQRHPSAIVRREVEGDKTHRELTVRGKNALRNLVQQEATLEDLAGVVEIVTMLRSLLGLTLPVATPAPLTKATS